MATINLAIEPQIIFNGHIYNRIEFTDSAQKHYKGKSVEIYQYIVRSLDGQYRTPDEDDKHGPVYKIASGIVSNEAPKILSDYRDTFFRTDTNTGAIIFFHGSPKRKKQFEKLPGKWKKRIE